MRYQNQDPPHEPPGLVTVLKWALRKRRKSPRRAPVPVVEPDSEAIREGVPSLTWVGHATWLVCLAGQRIVTDPVWSSALGPGIERNVAPGLPLALARPTVVVISHNHRDHLDAPTIARIGPNPVYVVPRGLGRFFSKRGCARVIELEWWQSTNIGELSITMVPSQHWSQRLVGDRNRSLWGGYVAQGSGRSVYFAGDTSFFSGFREIGHRFGSLDAALLPIGAYDPEWFMRSQHMNPDDAAAAFQDLGANLLCAMHWGTFKLTDEPLDEPPVLLRVACETRRIAAHKLWIAAIGETRLL